MLRVPMFLSVALLVFACGSTSSSTVPPVFPDQKAPPESVDASAPRGFVGSPETAQFHRLDCPETEKMDPRTRVFFDNPYSAVNAGFEPCVYCNPLEGWN